eukprot:scaffold143002_cov133-Phaeocystis_antarctica.AAC.2
MRPSVAEPSVAVLRAAERGLRRAAATPGDESRRRPRAGGGGSSLAFKLSAFGWHHRGLKDVSRPNGVVVGVGGLHLEWCWEAEGASGAGAEAG